MKRKIISGFLVTLFLLGASLISTPQSFAAEFEVDYTKSEISFSGTHAGAAFTGKFEDWTADITFDPENLDQSVIKATFKPASAKTGNALYDGTLPQADWFAINDYGEATFTSSKITQNDQGNYTVDGTLTIRGIEKPVQFEFTLTDFNTSPINAEATFEIDRLAYDIGKKSDAKAEWVSKMIGLQLKIVANKKS